jgi:FkbM family methyltransferase
MSAIRQLRRHGRPLLQLAVNYKGRRVNLSRRYIFNAARRITPYLAVEHAGAVLLLPTQDRVVAPETFVHGHYEIDKLDRVVRALRDRHLPELAGRGLIEVGANIGTTTVPALTDYGAAHVWAFEPSPRNLRVLRCNLLLNDLEHRATVLPIALSDAAGTMELQLSNANRGDDRLVVTEDDGRFGEASWERIPVEVARLDDVVSDLGIPLANIGLVWVDTQGHDFRVLAGSRLLTSTPIPVLVEYWPYGLHRAGDLNRFHELVARTYSTVLDIATDPPAEIASKQLPSHSVDDYTDLLLLK